MLTPNAYVEDLALPPGLWVPRHLGAVERPGDRPDAPQMLAFFSRLREGAPAPFWDTDDAYDPASLHNPVCCRLSAGLWPKMCADHVFEEGRWVGCGGGAVKGPCVVDLRDGRWRMVRGADLIGQAEDLHETARQSWYILARVKSSPGSKYERWMAIPCAEAARFWFFSSSNLIVLLLNGALKQHSPPDKNAVYDVAESVPRDPVTFDPKPLVDGGLVFVQRRRATVEEDAAVIGNLAYSNPDMFPENVARGHRAFESAVDLYSFLETDWMASQGGFAHLRVAPPYRGFVRLSVKGRVIIQGNRRTLLVSRIVRSTEPFPFGPTGKLIHDRDNNNDSDGVDDPNRRQAYSGTPRGRESSKKTGEEERTIKSGRPAARTEPKIFRLPAESRFVYLAGRRPQAVTRKTECTSRAVKRPPAQPVGPDVSPDPGTQNGTGLGVASVRSTDEVPPPSPPAPAGASKFLPANFETIISLADHLRGQGADCEFLTLGAPGGDIAAVFQSSVGCKWAYVNYYGKDHPQNRLRRVLILQVCKDRRYAYFLEIERSTQRQSEKFSMLALRQKTPDAVLICNADLKEVLQLCATRRSVVLAPGSLRDIHREQGPHHHASLTSLGESVLRFTSGKSLRAEQETKPAKSQRVEDAKIQAEVAEKELQPA